MSSRSVRSSRALFVVVLAVLVALVLQQAPALSEPVVGSGVAAAKPKPAPKQSDRGTAAGKSHRVGGKQNTHVPRSLRSYFPVAKNAKASNVGKVEKAPATSTPGSGRFDAKTSKEIASRRTETTKTFANADGSETTAIAPGPVNYLDDKGDWKPIDPEFEKDAAGSWQSTGGGLEVEVGGDRLAEVALDEDRSISWTLAGAARVQPQVEGDLATYREVLRDTDIEIQAQPAAAKETVVLRSAKAPTRFDFDLRLDGLTARLVDGQVRLEDADGELHATIPSGYATDATGESTTGVSYRLVGGDRLQVEVDAAWLRDPARTFPVRVDPSVLTPKQLKASSAMTVQSGGAYNASADFEVGGSKNARTYLRWDLSALANHTIYGANLSLVNYKSNSCVAREVAVNEVTENWSLNPDAYSLGNAPNLGKRLDATSFAYGYVPFGSSSSPCPVQGSLFELGVKGRDIVQGWANGGTNRGLAVTGTGWKQFVGPGASANRPTLYVTHSPYNAAYKISNPTPNPIVMQNANGAIKVTVTNKSAFAWASGDYSLRYRVFDSKGKAYSALPSFNAASMPALARGATTTVSATLKAMPAGMYFLDFSVVRNSPLIWFTDQQVAPVRLALQVFDVPPVVTQMYPQNGYSAPTLQPELFAKAIDVDATPGTTTYSFKVCTNSAMSTGCFTSGTATTASGWVVPAAKLSWSTQYYWNFTSGPTTSPTLTFFTDAPQPTLTSHLAGSAYGAQEREFDPSLGNYSTAAIDAAVATTGPDLTVARTYNSIDPRADGIFGAGWSTKFDVRAENATGSALVTMPDGQQVRFGKNSNATYAAPRGRNVSFVANGTTTWTMTDQSGSVYVFDQATGRLQSVKAVTGRAETFSYDAAGKLDKVVSGNSGRGLKFTWNAAGKVDTVATLDATGAVVTTWTYTYSGNLLTKVCSPTNSCTAYDYADGSHYRTAVLDTKPDSYWRLGESTGDTKAVSEVAVNLGKDEATYDAGVTLGAGGVVTNSTDTAATLAGAQAVRLPGGTSKKSRDMSVELWFKAAPSTTAMPLVGYQNKVFDGATAPTTGVPLLYIGADGKLRGQFADGTFAPVTSLATVTNDSWHHAVLTSVGTTTTLYVDGVKQNQKTSTINHVALTFNQLGAAYATTPGSWPSYGTVSKRYFKGSIDEVAVYSHGISAGEVTDHFKAAAGTKQLTKVTLPSGKVVSEIGYDVETDRVKEYTDQHGGTWTLGEPLVSGTTTDMRRTVVVKDPADRIYLYEYDALAGYLLRSAMPNGNGVRPQDAERCAAPSAEDPRFCAPAPEDPDNIQLWDISGSDIRSMDYDAQGRMTAVYNEIGDVVTMKYDARGNVTERTTCRTAPGASPSDCATSYTTYPTSTSGYTALDPRWDKPLTKVDPRAGLYWAPSYITEYTYNEAGQLLTQTAPAPELGKVTNTYSGDSEPGVDGGTIPSGLPLSTKDAASKTTSFAYFKSGDLARVTEPSGLVTKFGYDRLGRTVTKTEVWGGRETTTTYTYDEQSRVIKTLMPGHRDAVSGVDHQQQVVQTYDVDGNVATTEVADALGNDAARLTSYEYDDHNRMTRVTDPSGNEVAYEYDQFGNQTSMVDAGGTRTEFAYTARNKIAEVRLRDPDSTESSGFLVTMAYAYDAAGRLVATYDAMGRKVTIDYFHDDLVAKKTLTTFKRPGETQETPYVLEAYTYDKAGSVITEKTGNGSRQVTYTRDELGRVKTQTVGVAPLTRKTTYTYDLAGNVSQVDTTGDKSNVSWATTDTSSVAYGYDAAGRQTSETVTLPSGTATTTTAYDALGHITKVVSPRGNVAGANPDDYATTFSYDDAGNRTKVTAPPTLREEYGTAAATVSATEEIGYDTFGSPVASRDALGRVSSVEYDKRGLPVKQVAPSYTAPGTSTPVVPVTTIDYDANGNQTKVTDPRGSETRFDYDRLGRVVRVDAPAHDNDDRAVTTYDYTRTGQVRRVEGPLGTKVESTYDDLDRPVTSTVFETTPVADTFTTAYTYDDASNVTEITSPQLNKTTSTYDALGQLLTVKDPAGVQSAFGYDGAGRQVSVKDALGRVSRTDYDVAGRMTASTQLSASGTEGPKQTYGYDVEGNLTTSTPAGSPASTYEWDAASRLKKQVEPAGAGSTITTSFGYDAAGNRTRFTDGRGNETWYQYGTFGLESVIEPATLAHPALADRRWQTRYDPTGLPVQLTAPGGVTRQRAFDAAGRLVSETGSGAEAATASRTLTYDLLGRLTSASTPAGTNTYAYDQRGQLLEAAGPSGAATFSYDRDGQLAKRTDSSGTSIFGYTQGQLTSVTDGSSGAQVALTYDTTGAPATINYGAGRVRTFGYDAFGRQASDVLRNNGGQTVASTAYEYNAKGNVSRKTTTGVSGAADNTYTYDDAARLTSWSVAGGATTTYAWDASGNRTKVNGATATYDQRNRLVSDNGTDYSYSPRGSLKSRTNGSTTEAFTFDAFDRMISQGAKNYSYDAFDRVAQAGGKTFAYAGLDDDVVGDGTSTFGRGPGGGVISEKSGTRNRMLLSDQHGDVTGGFDPADTTLSALPDSRTFDPWGKKTATQGVDSAAGFQGSWTDPTTGEINMKARWYSATSGTFDSRDTASYSSGPSILANKYTYAAGDPVTLNDPDGNWPSCGICNKVKDKVSSTVSSAASSVKHYASSAYKYASSAASKVYGYGKAAVNAIADAGRWIYDKAKAGLNAVKNAFNATVNWAKDKISDGIEWAKKKAAEAAAAAHRAAVALTEKTKAVIEHAAKYNPLPAIKAAVAPVYAGLKTVVSAVANAPARIVQATVDVVKTTAKQVQAIYETTVKAVGKVVESVSTAVSAAGDWVKDNWKTIASVAAGIAVGAACTALTAGAGSVACAMLGTAVTGAVGGALDCSGGKSMAACMAKGAVDAVVAPVKDAVGCVTDPTISGCVSTALSVLPAAGSKVGGKFAEKYLKKLDGGCSCFAAGTKVTTAKGDKPIEKVKVGDKVVARDMVTGKKRLRTVKAVSSHVDTRMMTLVVAGEKIRVTTEHPFHTDQGWVSSGDLEVGDKVTLIDGGTAAITSITYDSKPTRVYNFEVEGDHNYAVTAAGVLVHNSACDLPGPGSQAKAADPGGVSISLKYKEGWTDAQKAAADDKVQALNDAAEAGLLRVTPVKRSGTSASSVFKKEGGTVPADADIDHVIDLQLGGIDDISNMLPLNFSVNRSLGSQIGHQIRGLQPGTCVISVRIC